MSETLGNSHEIDHAAGCVQQDVQQTADPSAELGTEGPDVVSCVRDAITSLGLGTDPAMNAGTTLQRSERFWRAVEAVKRDLMAEVRAALGSVDDAPTMEGVQECYVEARLFRTSTFLRLVDGGGPITGKGKTKALYRAYLDALDREVKLAQILGLSRKARDIRSMTADAWIEQERQKREQESTDEPRK